MVLCNRILIGKYWFWAQFFWIFFNTKFRNSFWDLHTTVLYWRKHSQKICHHWTCVPSKFLVALQHSHRSTFISSSSCFLLYYTCWHEFSHSATDSFYVFIFGSRRPSDRMVLRVLLKRKLPLLHNKIHSAPLCGFCLNPHKSIEW